MPEASVSGEAVSERARGPGPALNTGNALPPPGLPYRELFLHLAEHSPDAVFTKDLQGRYTFINSAGACFLGHEVEEILGHKDDELVSPEEAETPMEFDRQVLLAGRVLHSEMSERMAGAQREWFSTKGILRSEAGQVIGLFGIARDLSTQLRGASSPSSRMRPSSRRPRRARRSGGRASPRTRKCSRSCPGPGAAGSAAS
jgi:two-component system, NtrC family, sensor kinase